MVVSRADIPTISGFFAFDGFQIVFDGVVDSEVDDVEAGTFHHHADKVLADVVNVALDGTNHHLALLRRAGGGKQRAQDVHPSLHRVGREQNFRHEQDAITKVDANDPHAFNESLGQDVVGGPSAFEKNPGAFLDFLLQPVVKVVVHLLHEFFVGEFRENDFVV